jgi:serine/threonine protein kinase
MSLVDSKNNKQKTQLEISPMSEETLDVIHVGSDDENVPTIEKPLFPQPPTGWNLEEKGPPEIDPSEIEYDEETDFLGEGTFGKVFRGRCRGKKVAVKVPAHQQLTPEELQDFRKEVQIMSKIFHPNVVLFMGASTKAGQIKIVTELMDTDLENYLRSEEGRKTPLFQRLKMAKDAALGMNWLHGITKIIHRDFKPANLLINLQDMVVKVTDFGFSEFRPEITGRALKDKFGPRGTALWMAPEVMQGLEFDEKVDVYAFGIVLWELVMLMEPFAHHDDWDTFFDAIVYKRERPPLDDKTFLTYNKPQQSARDAATAHTSTKGSGGTNSSLPTPSQLPSTLTGLISACWSHNPKDRPPFSKVVSWLDEAMLEVAIENVAGREFWREAFVLPHKDLQERVSWHDFVRALSAKTKIRDKTKFDHLYELIVEGNNEVTIHKFNHMLNWFGPFCVPEHAKRILDEINDIINRPWFHGEIDLARSENLLKGKEPGTFLVRLSTTYASCPFTLSIAEHQHKRIQKVLNPDGTATFSIVLADKKTVKNFPSLIALIEGVSKIFKLTTPCPKEEEADTSNPYE